MQETWVQSLGWEDPLEKGMAILFSTLAWRIPWTEPGGLQFMGPSLAKSRTWQSNFHFHFFPCFTWCWRRLLNVPWTARGSNQSNLKEIFRFESKSWILIERTNAEAWLLWPPDAKSRLIGKDLDAGKDWQQKEKRVTEYEMVGWYHWFNGHELGQTLEDGGGQRGLVCCSLWSHKELDTAWRLNNNALQWAYNEAQGLLKNLIFHHLGHGSNQSYGHVILFKIVLYPLPPVSAVPTSWLYCRSQPSMQW